VRVRPAEPADYDAIARLTLAAYRSDGQLATETSGYAAVLADVAGRAEHGEVLVAVDDSGTPLGAVMFVLPGSRYAELSQDGEAEFRMLAVDPAAQRRGVARALVQACLDRAAALGRSDVVICSRDFAVGAHRLYERMGFVRLPERDWSPLEGVTLLAFRCAVSVGSGAPTA
jgi:ribosomal protein S18 acetylase RimI-like enzyme